MNDRKYRSEHGRRATVGSLRTKAADYFKTKRLPQHPRVAYLLDR